MSTRALTPKTICLGARRARDPEPLATSIAPSCWTVKRARYFRADLACVCRDGPQLRLKVFDLNAESFLEILRTQELFHEVMVCCSLPLKVCFESGYSIFIGTPPMAFVNMSM